MSNLCLRHSVSCSSVLVAHYYLSCMRFVFEMFRLCSTPANLSALAFDGATKRNKPNLNVGALVFARVESIDPDVDPELTCKASESGASGGQKKDWVTGQGMYGELKHGTVVQVPLMYCRR